MALQTTDSVAARIVASSVIVVLLFVMILVVTCIQEPDAYQKAFKKKSKFQERLNRAYKENRKIKEEHHYHSRLN